MSRQLNLPALAALVAFLAAPVTIGALIPRHTGGALLFAYLTAFVAYIWWCRRPIPFGAALGLGLTARILLFVSMPSLSDDIYRFLWDGFLVAAGHNPYAYPPSALVEQGAAWVNVELYLKLNSPEYHSVYPPFSQLIFWLGAQAGDQNWLLGTNTIRTVLVLADVGSFLLLTKLLVLAGRERHLANWYFLNPLLILEGTGNGHLEGLMVFFILLGLYTLGQRRQLAAGAAFGMAAATKVVPLIFVPALLTRSRGIQVAAVALAIGAVPLIMMPAWGAAGVFDSFALYFQKFEFNASAYYLLREAGFWLKGYNTIGTLGPALSVASILGIGYITYRGWKSKWPLPKTFLFALTVYLACSTTVHPWYLLPLLAFGLLSGYFFPVLWSLLIFITYFGYTPEGFELSLAWVALEYVLVFLFFLAETNLSFDER